MITRISKREFQRLKDLANMNPEWKTGLYFQAPNGLYYKTDTRGLQGGREMHDFITTMRQEKRKQQELTDILNKI